jgi:hypothetical protein
MQIDHHHKQTRVAFLKRTNRLKEADVWFPLTIKEEWVTLNPNTLYIWDFVSVTSSDFAAIVTCHDDLWNVSGRQSWAKILINWGLEIAPKIEKHNKINWVNFIGSGSTKPVSLFVYLFIYCWQRIRRFQSLNELMRQKKRTFPFLRRAAENSRMA